MKLNVTVKEWGPSCWKFLINVALRYDEEFNWQQARQFQVFLYQLQYVLPCEKCRHHYHDYLRSNPPNLHTRMELLLWLHKLYNTIKAREGYSKTFDEFMAIGESMLYWLQLIFMETNKENDIYNNVESSYGKSTVNYRTHSGF